MSSLPPPDPAAGHAASLAAEEARDVVEAGLKDGSLDLAAVFGQVDAEGEHHVIGHMHARALLLALPKVGEKKANEILDAAGIAHDEHIARLGPHQRRALIETAHG